MWLIIYMLAVVIPLIIWGFVSKWHEENQVTHWCLPPALGWIPKNEVEPKIEFTILHRKHHIIASTLERLKLYLKFPTKL